MPFEEGIGLEEQHDLAEPCAGTGGHHRQFLGKDKQDAFLPAGDAKWLGLFPLENAELVSSKQDLDVYVIVGSTVRPGQVNQDRQRLCQKKEEHGGKGCRDHAEDHRGIGGQARWAPLKGLGRPRRIFRTLRELATRVDRIDLNAYGR